MKDHEDRCRGGIVGGVRMGNHRHNRLKITLINLWYKRQAWFSTTRSVVTASLAPV